MTDLPAEPEAFPTAFRDAWTARDGAAIGRLFAPDADFVNVVGIWWENREAIGAAHGKALASFFAGTVLILGRSKVRLLGDLAVVHQRVILKGQKAPDGGEAGDRHTILLFVLRREADGWIGVAAQNTDILPGAETRLILGPARYRGD